MTSAAFWSDVVFVFVAVLVPLTLRVLVVVEPSLVTPLLGFPEVAAMLIVEERSSPNAYEWFNVTCLVCLL
jgi:hypothetical protein